MRPLFLLVLLLIKPVLAVAQSAQAEIRGPVSSQVLWAASRGPLRQPLAPDTVRREIRPTHWKEDAVVGGAAGGLALAFLSVAFCEGGEDCVSVFASGFLLGAGPGGLIGALIGGMFPKDEDP